jgi:hypothetical protein
MNIMFFTFPGWVRIQVFCKHYLNEPSPLAKLGSLFFNHFFTEKETEAHRSEIAQVIYVASQEV